MEWRKATQEDAPLVHDIVQQSIRGSYPACYPEEVVQFFEWLHRKERIAEDIRAKDTRLFYQDGKAVATCCIESGHLSLLYILPEYQGRGLGSRILQLAEKAAAKTADTVTLEPSDFAAAFYQKRGYQVIHHESRILEDGFCFVHDTMEKKLH